MNLDDFRQSAKQNKEQHQPLTDEEELTMNLDDFRPEDCLIPKKYNNATLYSICNEEDCYIKVTAVELVDAYDRILDKLRDERVRLLQPGNRRCRRSDPITERGIRRAVASVNAKIILIYIIRENIITWDLREYFIKVNRADYAEAEDAKLENTYIYDIASPKYLVGVYEQAGVVDIDPETLKFVLDTNFYFRAYMITVTDHNSRFLKSYSKSKSNVVVVPLSSEDLRSAELAVISENERYIGQKCVCCGKLFPVPSLRGAKRTICLSCKEARKATAVTSVFNS